MEVQTLLAIVSLKDQVTFSALHDSLSLDTISRFFQECTCIYGCRMLRYSYSIPPKDIIDACEIGFGQMLNRYDSSADDELGLLLPILLKRNTIFLLTRLQEIIGQEHLISLFAEIGKQNLDLEFLQPDMMGEMRNNRTVDKECSVDSIEGKGELSFQESIDNLRVEMQKQFGEEIWNVIKSEIITGKRDDLLVLYIDHFLSQPHSTEEVLMNGLWYAQMYAENEEYINLWFFLSAAEKLGRDHPILEYINTLCDDVRLLPHGYWERITSIIDSMYSSPYQLAEWIDWIGEANPYSFSHDYFKHEISKD